MTRIVVACLWMISLQAVAHGDDEQQRADREYRRADAQAERTVVNCSTYGRDCQKVEATKNAMVKAKSKVDQLKHKAKK